MADPEFIHLNCHSYYSLLEGALSFDALIAFAQKDGMPAIGVADTANLFGALEFSEKAKKAGIQPIIGCKVPVTFDGSEQQSNGTAVKGRAVQRSEYLTILAMSSAGYRNLVRIVTDYYLTNQGLAEAVSLADLNRSKDDLLVLTGGHDGPIYSAVAAGDMDQAESRMRALSEIFGDRLYVSLERHGMTIEQQAEAEIVELAYGRDLPLVATNEPMFKTPEDHGAHDALLAIADGRMVSEDDRRRMTPQHQLASSKEMVSRFSDLPEAVENTVEIAQRCHFRPRIVAPILPRFTATSGDPDAVVAQEAAELRQQASQGLIARLEAHGCAPGLDRQVYLDRLEMELGVIEGMKYPGYFLIVADFIKWAKGEGIAVGPGRGSGAGSVVAWALTITDLDPLRFGLLFERFLNPERVSMPDFDIDFCQERRDEVIGYVQQRYGSDQVAQIITFGTLQARAALRDVGRVLEMPYGQVDRICKMVPADPANPVGLAEAIAGDPRFDEARNEEPIVGQLLDIAMKLEGLYRHASTHAAGIVIGDRPLPELVPLYRDSRSDLPVTQFNMKWVEQAGLVKFDFLGLKTLTVLEKTIEFLRRQGMEIDLGALPLDDEKTFAMLARGETVGVFQLESQGMRRALVGMQADRFEDIIALVALYRPGPMDNIPTYNRRKHGDETPDYLHAMIEPILKETYGVIIYQEQVMQIAQTLSGYSLGEADLLRRAMGKKIKSEMDAQRERFVDGAVERGVIKSEAVMIFDLVAKFASYGFNKSHAAAYALVAYQTAYLKANFPCEFLAASMTLDMGNTDKVNEFRLEAERLDIEVRPPDVNKSNVAFDVEGGHINYAFSALKGFGSQVAEHLVTVRENGPYQSLADFAVRIDPQQVGRRGLECLIQAGAFDTIEPDRSTLLQNSSRILSAAQERVRREQSGVDDLFLQASQAPELHLDPAVPWSQAERLHREFQATGAYLTAHPLDDYGDLIANRGGQTWKVFAEKVRQGRVQAGLLSGTVTQKQERRTRNGGRIGLVMLSDPTGQFEAMIYQERLNEWRDILEIGRSFFVKVSADYDDETDDVRVRVISLEGIDDESEKSAHALTIHVEDQKCIDHLRNRLSNSGSGSVTLVVQLNDPVREVQIKLPGSFEVSPGISSAIKGLPGVSHVVFH